MTYSIETQFGNLSRVHMVFLGLLLNVFVGALTYTRYQFVSVSSYDLLVAFPGLLHVTWHFHVIWWTLFPLYRFQLNMDSMSLSLVESMSLFFHPVIVRILWLKYSILKIRWFFFSSILWLISLNIWNRKEEGSLGIVSILSVHMMVLLWLI